MAGNEREQRTRLNALVQESINDRDHHFRELANVISLKNAVAYVGAGVSAASGLPTWHSLLQTLIEETVKRLPMLDRAEERARLDRLLERRRYLAIADRVQASVDDVTKVLETRFRTSGEPSSLHRAVTRLPFSLFVTTNYDNLLDRALPQCNTHTWNDVSGVFGAIQDRSGNDVIHSHGVISRKETIVLTHASYRRIIHNSQAFRDCMRTLLASRTLLFIGCSLSDPYLENLLEEHASRFGDRQPSHYILWPDDENTDLTDRYWASTYGVQVLRYPIRELIKAASGSPIPADELRTLAVERVLTVLSGMVADIRSKKRSGIALDSTLLSRNDALREILETAIRETGSFRGEIALLDPVHSNDAPSPLRWYFSSGPTRSQYNARPGDNYFPIVPRDSIIGTTFHTMPEIGAMYVSDLDDWPAERAEQGFSSGSPVLCHSDMKSEFACCIYASGEPLGVLNLESRQRDGYTTEHQLAIRRYAERVGVICAASDALVKQNARLLDPDTAPGLKLRIKAFWDAVPALRALDLDLIMYGLDYLSGSLTEASAPAGQPPYTFKFFQSSAFASSVVEKFPVVSLDDIEIGVTQGHAAERCLSRGIRGPVLGFRIRLGESVQGLGTLAGAIVVWSNHAKASHGWPVIAERLRANFDVIQSVAHLALNDMSATSDLVGRMVSLSQQAITDNTQVSSELAQLCGTARLRVFQALGQVTPSNSHQDHQFRVVSSTDPQFLNNITDRTYLHCAYTLDRWAQNTRSRRHLDLEFQNTSVPWNSGAAKFGLTPQDPWLMAPIVEWRPVADDTAPNRKRLVAQRLLGYATVDNVTRPHTTIQTRMPLLRLDVLAALLADALIGVNPRESAVR